MPGLHRQGCRILSMLDPGWGQAGIEAHKLDTSHYFILILAACAAMAQQLRFRAYWSEAWNFKVPLGAKPPRSDPQTLDCVEGGAIIPLTLWPWAPATLEYVEKRVLSDRIMTVSHVAFRLCARMTSCVSTSRESEGRGWRGEQRGRGGNGERTRSENTQSVVL